ncbi:hypothetical protein, partial [Ketobacter sp.]
MGPPLVSGFLIRAVNLPRTTSVNPRKSLNKTPLEPAFFGSIRDKFEQNFREKIEQISAIPKKRLRP